MNYHNSKNDIFNNKDYPTNMSIKNCQFPSFLGYNTPFRKNIESNKHFTSHNTNINPQIMLNKYSKDFQRISCTNNINCPKIQYISKDPRLISVQHNGQVLTLDRPPLQSKIMLSKIPFDKNLNHYGQNYKTYSDIDGGDIMYYTGNIQDPFISPVFSNNSVSVTGTLYKTPMTNIWPVYTRKPLKNIIGTEKDTYDDCLSFTTDTNNFRNDIISKQMSKINRQQWSTRWKNN